MLVDDDEGSAKVEETFHNAFYIRTYNGDLVLVTNRAAKSPVTINLDSTLDLEQIVKPNDRICVQGEEVGFGDEVFIDLTGALRYSHMVDHLRFGGDYLPVKEELNDSALILGIIDTKRSVLDPGGLAKNSVSKFVQKGVIPFRSIGNDLPFQGEAWNLVGLGSGLTPSGDDVLGGFLATFNSLAQSVSRSIILLPSDLLQRKTSWISAELLDYMQRLAIDEEMEGMIVSGAAGDRDGFIIALENLLSRGHTSGIDISVGIILALSLVRDIAFCEIETETLARKLGLYPASPTVQ
jgi:hypothetical protein